MVQSNEYKVWQSLDWGVHSAQFCLPMNNQRSVWSYIRAQFLADDLCLTYSQDFWLLWFYCVVRQWDFIVLTSKMTFPCQAKIVREVWSTDITVAKLFN